MIPRYTRPRMGAVWSTENRLNKWLEVELAACEGMAELGLVPEEAAKEIVRKAAFDPARVEEIEKEVKHDVVAFLTNVGENVGEAAKYIHMGMTSSDVLDTALALQMREAADIILEGLDRTLNAIKDKALEHKHTPMIGRTHGIHAEPITFGLKMALWYQEMERNRERLVRAGENISYGKISGAVGTFAHLPPQVEEKVCARLGLKPAPASSQIIQRDRHAEYMAALAITASSMDKFAVEIRHLQRTEVLEAEEFFSEGQKGSSAMPHKRNPISMEQISGLARVVRANAMAAMENIPLWHERDISHSSVERVIIPDSTILVDYMLNRLADNVEKLQVYPRRMMENLERTRGLIYSQRLLLALVEEGVSREEAYSMVQDNAMRAWKEGLDFRELIAGDNRITRHLSEEERHKCFDLEHQLRYVDDIFRRVFEA